jgi:hypothetical protein
MVRSLHREVAAFPSRWRRLGRVYGSKNLRTGPLSLLPQGQRLANGLCFVVHPAVRKRVADEGFLVWREVYVLKIAVPQRGRTEQVKCSATARQRRVPLYPKWHRANRQRPERDPRYRTGTFRATVKVTTTVA